MTNVLHTDQSDPNTDSFSYPVVGLPLALLVLLQDKAPLLQAYTKLLLLDQMMSLKNMTCRVVAQSMGLTPQHFTKIINQLESLGMVKKIHSGRKVFLELTLPKHLLTDQQVTKLLTMNKNVNNVDSLKSVDLLSKKLKVLINKEKAETLTLPYILFTNKPNTNNLILNIEGGGEPSLKGFSDSPGISSKYINNRDTNFLTEAKKKKKEVQRFPKIQYNQVLVAYKKYTGVERKGTDLSFAWKSVRNLFLAGHKPKEIIEFMEWISENQDDPKYKWLKLWNMETVRKLLPDYLSGRLTNEEEDINAGFKRLN